MIYLNIFNWVVWIKCHDIEIPIGMKKHVTLRNYITLNWHECFELFYNWSLNYVCFLAQLICLFSNWNYIFESSKACNKNNHFLNKGYPTLNVNDILLWCGFIMFVVNCHIHLTMVLKVMCTIWVFDVVIQYTWKIRVCYMNMNFRFLMLFSL